MSVKSILLNKYYEEESVFTPENLLREARRQMLLIGKQKVLLIKK